MSLLSEAFESYKIQDKVTTADGYGGVITTWIDGAEIKAAVVYNGSAEMQAAMAMGANASYTITVRRNTELDYHTVLKRVSDGKIFRVTANSDDNKTPKSAGLDMRQYTAEEYTL